MLRLGWWRNRSIAIEGTAPSRCGSGAAFAIIASVPVPETELYRRHFAQIQEQASQVTADLNEARFNWRPAPGEWSIEECLAHLVIVGQWEIRAIEQAVEQGKQRGITGQ